MDSNVEVPEYFICPISLQIMQDPVTATSGITYDRHSIEQWLFTNRNTICPVTKHPLHPDNSAVTPNHTLRRLIQAWCTLHAPHGVDLIPTPKTPLTKFHVNTLITRLRDPDSRLTTLHKLEALALEGDRNRAYMVEADLGETLLKFMVACRKSGATDGLEQALSIFYTIRVPLSQSSRVLNVNDDVIDSLTWALECDRFRDDGEVKARAACALKGVVQKANPGVLERLKREFFETMLRNLRGGMVVSEQGRNAVLQVLLEACPWGRNRVVMVESGAVFELVEMELEWGPGAEKKTTELMLGIIYQLCSCADGRAQLLSHAAGIAVVTRRMVTVSAAVLIIWQISKYSATVGVVQEMLRVGTVGNLCLVMVADSGCHLKEKARKILRMHFHAWKDSPCIDMAALTRYTS